MGKQYSNKVAYVATLYKHLADFSMPHMKLLQSLGFEVHIYAYEPRRKEDLLNEGFICHDLAIKRNPIHWENLKSLLFLYKEFRKYQFHLVHCHTAMGGVVGRIAAKLSGIKNIYYTVHGFFFFKNAPIKNWILYYSMERMLANWTDYLVVVNKEDFDYAKDFNIRKELIHIPEHTYKKKFQDVEVNEEELRNSLGISDETMVIIYIAEFIHRKNQVQLVNAMNILKNIDVKVLFVGEGEDLDMMKDYTKQKDLDKCCLFLGFRRDIPQLLAVADVSMLLSYHEGLPVCLLESLAAGKPIIASDIRGNKDLVEIGKNGFLIEINDVEATAEAIKWSEKNRDKLKEMGKKSREMGNQYDISDILPKIENLYKKIQKNEN